MSSMTEREFLFVIQLPFSTNPSATWFDFDLALTISYHSDVMCSEEPNGFKSRSVRSLALSLYRDFTEYAYVYTHSKCYLLFFSLFLYFSFKAFHATGLNTCHQRSIY